jgi:hypothetical protein
MSRPKVFLSYSHEDAGFADQLATALQKRGADVWVDAKRVLVGDSITESVERALSMADFVCVILSSNSSRRPWVQREYRAALNLQLARIDQRPRLLPIVIDNTEVPPLLTDIRHADFGRDFNEAFEQLCAAANLPTCSAPFVELLAALRTGEESPLARYLRLERSQDILELSHIWRVVRAAADQLEAELKVNSRSGRVLVNAPEISPFLSSDERATAVLMLPDLSMRELLSYDRDDRFSYKYSLEMKGVAELIETLVAFEDAVTTRRLYVVPATVSWTRHWDNLPDRRLDLGSVVKSIGRWSGPREMA